MHPDLKILPHPNKDRDLTKRVVELLDGKLTIEYDGEIVTNATAVYLIEQAKLIIMGK